MPEVVGVGVSLELIGTIMQIRSRGLWDLGNKDDGVCYGCNWKMVKSGRFCTRTCLLLSLQDNSHPKSPTKVETKRKLQQFTVSGWLIMNGGEGGNEKKKTLRLKLHSI